MVVLDGNFALGCGGLERIVLDGNFAVGREPGADCVGW